jgi:hypothetical protein
MTEQVKKMKMFSSNMLPLTYRMVNGIEVKPKRGIEDHYKSARNVLRKYSATSLVNVALDMIWDADKTPLEKLQDIPWLTLLLVKWGLQDNLVCLHIGPSITKSVIEQLRSDLWQIQNKRPQESERQNVFVMLRKLMYVQLEFQRNESWGFLRWPALLADLDPNHVCRRSFRALFQMEPDVYIDMAFALYAATLNRREPINQDWLSPLRNAYGDHVDSIVNLFSRDLAGLRIELQRDLAQKIHGRHELFEFPYLKRFPFVRFRDGSIRCWHPLVLARGMEDAVHLRLSELGQEYTNSFSRVFENYVTDLAASCGMPYVDEATYKSQLGPSSPSVEMIIEGENCNILVEAKMSLFGDDVLLQDSDSVVYSKVKRVRDAVNQGWRVGELIRSSESGFGERFMKKQDFLLVVTSRDLIIGGGLMLQRLCPPGKFVPPDDDAATRMPVTNIFVLSIEEFERVVGCVASGEINLSKFLSESAEENSNGATERLYLSDFLSKHTDQWHPSKLIESARSQSESRLTRAFEYSK